MTDVSLKLNKPHIGQLRVLSESARFNVVECGRRWGKTALGQHIDIIDALKGHPCGWFAPSNKYLMDPWREIEFALKPITKHVHRKEQRIELHTGGTIDFWSLENVDAGRGRKYKKVVIDESSLIRNFKQVWTESIRPTLTDLKGSAWFLGTPKGRKYFHELYQRGQQAGNPKWKSWRLGTADNPYIPKDEVEEARLEYEEMGLSHIFDQEYLGIPADDGGNPFDSQAIAECTIDHLSGRDPVAFGVDLGKRQDWTVIIGLDAEAEVCVLDRFQIDWSRTRQRILSTVNGWPTLIDATGVGDPIVEELSSIRPNITGFVFTSHSKQQLMEGLMMAIGRRLMRFLKGWLVDELESFEYEYKPGGRVVYQAPSGLHDDGVCALGLAYRHFEQMSMNPLDVRVIGAGRR